MAFFRILRRVMPAVEREQLDRPMPWDVWPYGPAIHLMIFVHRVEGLTPGFYFLVRDQAKLPLIQQSLNHELTWTGPDGCPEDLPLYWLLEGDARRAAVQVSCDQAIAGDSAFSLGMLAEFEGRLRQPGAWFYPRLFWEAGLLGQVLYLGELLMEAGVPVVRPIGGVALDVVAGVGLALGYGWLAERAPVFQKRAIQVAVLGCILLLHGAGALQHYPYYYTYANPLPGALLDESQASGVGYGEGLELAAGYLAAKPGAEEMTAISYYAFGPFSYFFPGETLTLKTDDRFSPEDLQELKEADYLVIYSVRQQPRNGSTALLTALESIPPEKNIWLDGVKVASIYPIDRFPESLFAAISE